MFTKNELQKMLYFDIETVTEYATLESLAEANPLKAKTFRKYCKLNIDKGQQYFIDNTPEFIYVDRAPVLPEYSKVACVSLGLVKWDGTTAKSSVECQVDHDEKIVLTKTSEMIQKFGKAGYSLCGHNIKGFDIPFLIKRMILHRIKIPDVLKIVNKKPWELSFIDTKDIWKFGSWSTSTFDEITVMLGLPTPKDDIDGSEVGRVYWIENDLDRIATYCDKDVHGVINLMRRISGFYDE